jgi:hypothetical protein
LAFISGRTFGGQTERCQHYLDQHGRVDAGV